MSVFRPRAFLAAATLVSAALWGCSGIGSAFAQDAVQRGAYIFDAADCVGCHTDVKNKGKPLAGGRALDTPYGVFYSPNITPDPETGIGRWTEQDFMRAMRHGEGKDGELLFPSFPYPSFTKMKDQDILDLYAFLMAQPPVKQTNRPHDMDPPFGWRFMLTFWQALFLTEGPVADIPGKSAEWNRGRYLVDAPGHCGECHSRRGTLGAVDPAGYLAGVSRGPEGAVVPAINSRSRKLTQWSVEDIADFLGTGMTPDGDFVGSAMAEVVRNSTSKITAADRRAIAVYLKDLPRGR